VTVDSLRSETTSRSVFWGINSWRNYISDVVLCIYRVIIKYVGFCMVTIIQSFASLAIYRTTSSLYFCIHIIPLQTHEPRSHNLFTTAAVYFFPRLFPLAPLVIFLTARPACKVLPLTRPIPFLVGDRAVSEFPENTRLSRNQHLPQV